MVAKKLSHYDLMRLWKNGFDAKRGYFVGKPDETALDCAQEMGLQNIEFINIAGSIVGENKENKQIVIAWVIVPYAVDITDELEWSDDF
jgi:hypothetical protein